MHKSILTAVAAFAVPAAAQVMAPPPAPPGPPAAPAMGRPMMNDYVQTRAEVIARTQRMFAMIDRNHDGALDQAEIAAAGEQRGGDRAEGGDRARGEERMPLDRNAVFDRIDANHNGTIDRDEFARAPMPHHDGMADGGSEPGKERGDRDGDRDHDRHGGGMGRLLAMADANRDGRITLQELTDAATRRFDMMDSNHDGQVTADERAAAHAQMKAMRGQQ